MMTPYKYDYLIIGTGLAGLSAAHHASQYGKVALISKDQITLSSSYYAQGGIAAAIDIEDHPISHYEDTITVGDGLCINEHTKILIEEGIKAVNELIELGMKFDQNEGRFSLSLEGGHSKKRVLHAGGTATGKELILFLKTLIADNNDIDIWEHTKLSQLCVKDKICCGAIVNKKDAFEHIIAKNTILASGGACSLFKRTTNPSSSLGEGIMLAQKVGAELSNLEFIQFHPTALRTSDNKTFLLSEALRGEGAHLVNQRNERFMIGKHKLNELAPRNIVSYQIYNQIYNQNNQVFLTLSHLDITHIKTKFYAIYDKLKKYGYDLTVDRIPIEPAAHYFIGGIKTNIDAETNIKNLFAIGECANKGVHGANRLASNSLLECLVFSKRAIEKSRMNLNNEFIDLSDVIIPDQIENEIDLSAIKNIMSKYCGIVRNEKSLTKGLLELEELNEKYKNYSNSSSLSIQDYIDLASLIFKMALERKESRGTHIRDDFPYKSDNLIGEFISEINYNIRYQQL